MGLGVGLVPSNLLDQIFTAFGDVEKQGIL
jgi:hypothetical protein